MVTSQASPLIPSSQVVDYPARDMTITVGSGMAIGTLQRILFEEHQQLPIDADDDSMTLGEIIAEDISGPRRYGYGTLRDYVLGIEVMDGRGRVFHAGGRVVKNVAGYDLCRLLVGSGGRLGTILQLTLKLKPLPPQQALLVAGFRSSRDLESALQRLNVSATCPVILDVISRSAQAVLLTDSFPDLAATLCGADSAFTLVVGFEGLPVACQWQAKMLRDELQGTSVWVHESTRTDATSVYCRKALLNSRPASNAGWMFRLTTVPSRITAALGSLQEAGCHVFGRAGNGVLFAWPWADAAQPKPHADEQQCLTLLQSLVSDGVGSVHVLQSTSGQSTQSSCDVQRISQKLQALLGP